MRRWLQYMFILVLSGLTQTVAAQIFLGIRGGIGYTNILYDSYRPGISLPAGLFINWQWSKHWALHTEANHLLLGGTLPDNNEINTIETRLHYLDVPVMLQYRYLVYHSGINAYVQAGPSVKLLLLAQDVNNSSTYSNPAETTIIIPDKNNNKYIKNTTSLYRTWNYGMAAATGLAWQMARESMFLEVGLDRGLFPIQRDVKDNINDTILWYLAIGLGYEL